MNSVVSVVIDVVRVGLEKGNLIENLIFSFNLPCSMRCLHPVKIKTPDKILQDPKSWKCGLPPPRYMYVPCGRCINCFHMRRLNWVIRMEKELEVSTSCYFITCTYADEFMPRTPEGLPTLSKRDHQLFMKRLRKLEQDSNIRFFMCGEYGENFDRPHLHYVLFNLSHDYLAKAFLVQCNPEVYRSLELESIWQHGHVQIGAITPGGMSYVAKYCQWQEAEDVTFYDPSQEKPFALMSRRPAIGANYLEKDWRSDHLYRDGHVLPMPRYYRDKMELPKDYSFLYDSPEIMDKDVRTKKNMLYNEKLYFDGQKKRKKDIAGL